MSFLKKLFGSDANNDAKPFRARIQMGLGHTESQRADVAAAVSEFVAAHSGNISSKPEITPASDGSVVGISLVTKDADEAMALDQDLRRRVIAHGIHWDQ